LIELVHTELIQGFFLWHNGITRA